MSATLKSFISKVDTHINPYTVALSVFFLWSLASRFGLVPGCSEAATTTNEDGDEIRSQRGHWNLSQSLVVAGVVLATYFLLKRKQGAAALPIIAGGITLPEGASILMPSDVSKSTFADVGGSGDGTGNEFLSGPAPF